MKDWLRVILIGIIVLTAGFLSCCLSAILCSIFGNEIVMVVSLVLFAICFVKLAKCAREQED